MNNYPKLSNCPFCGNLAEFKEYLDDDEGRHSDMFLMIICDECDINIRKWVYSTYSELPKEQKEEKIQSVANDIATIWNKRI